MFIKFNVSGVKGGSFENDEKQVIEYGYVYAIGEFRDFSREDTIQTGLQVNKFKCKNKAILSAIRNILIKAGGPVDITLDIDFAAKEGALSVPSVVGIGQ
jgi:hypothetical protein